jgi:hypothetical protein
MRHTHYGNLPGEFIGTGWILFKRGWWLWLVGVGSVVLVAALIVALIGAVIVGGSGAARAGTAVAAISTFFILGIAYLFIWPLFRAIQLRWRLEGIRFGELTLATALTKGAVFKCYLKAWLVGLGLVLLVALIVSLSVGVGAVAFKDVLGSTTPSYAAIVSGFVSYLAVLTGLGVIKLCFLDRGIWAAAVNSVTVINIAALDAVAAQGRAADVVGEGLADALDFSPGF